MRLRPDILLCAGLLIFMSGCAGNQWNEHLVEGSNGIVKEIRVGGQPSGVVQGQGMAAGAVQVGSVQDPQSRAQLLQARLAQMAAMLPMQSYTDYKVGPEDLLQVTFFTAEQLTNGAPTDNLGGGSSQLSGLFRVDGQGDIRLLLVGNVQVSGLTPVQIAEKLAGLYKSEGYLVNPQITVTVKEYRHSEVAVSGAVHKPGYYPLIGPRSLLDVLGMAGGLADKAGDTANIVRPRPGASKYAGQHGLNADTLEINLNSLLIQGDTSLNIPIQNGDVVFVPFAQSAYVIGSVKKPGNVLLRNNMTLTRAVSVSEGRDRDLASNYVTILRVGADGRREVRPFDLSQILKGQEPDVVLQPNDIVYVHESKARRFFYDLKNFLPGSLGIAPTIP
jgi:polysaccharide export outer membrane protein